MSNTILPKLNTILPPLPKQNIIIPLDIISNNYDSFPPMKTPIIQKTNKNMRVPRPRFCLERVSLDHPVPYEDFFYYT